MASKDQDKNPSELTDSNDFNEKLLQRADKPVTIPEIEKPKLKAPKDIVRNVQGSGEFHVYRAHRRREYTRLKIMEEEARKEDDNDGNDECIESDDEKNE
ncbi:11278_t:CDS:2 [Racocetra fulgida]|uniref:11278_t:CDS:1 n=2 Tax=Glomeromycetes TaxID=214506 RepID=A0A9N8W4N5_9GLOM|nr:11278_t:CDS:2 [Racocetra fulgida]